MNLSGRRLIDLLFWLRFKRERERDIERNTVSYSFHLQGCCASTPATLEQPGYGGYNRPHPNFYGGQQQQQYYYGPGAQPGQGYGYAPQGSQGYVYGPPPPPPMTGYYNNMYQRPQIGAATAGVMGAGAGFLGGMLIADALDGREGWGGGYGDGGNTTIVDNSNTYIDNTGGGGFDSGGGGFDMGGGGFDSGGF